MDNSTIVMLAQVLVAFLLGALIGWERERHGREAGIRTFGAIAVGACVFGLISIYGLDGLGLFTGDPTRIASNVVVGVGFLGAGIIFHRDGDHVAGLTTAATLWTTAAVGLAVAFHMYSIAFLVTLIMFLVLWLPKVSWWKWVSAKKNR
jgi:putative Mg2+ transporter-C (MgtC) family protein